MVKDEKFKRFVTKSFERHVNGDWGDVNDWEKETNNQALRKNEGELFSKYKFNGQVIYIITESDRSKTTILLSKQ